MAEHEIYCCQVNNSWRCVVFFCSLLFLNACATPTRQNEKYAAAHGFKQLDVQGTDFSHTVFLNRKTKGKIWHVYIEGDGKPWIDQRFVAQDPTTLKPLMLRLMTQDQAPAIYLGRPCYHGKNKSEYCNPLHWTHERYSEQIVSSMAAALKKLIAIHHIQKLILIGHSGGGTLAMLLAEKIPETKILVTLAGNLDIVAWADQHGYSRLQGSLNPAFRESLPTNILQYHYLGRRDQNIKTSMITPVINKQETAGLFLIDSYGHYCCWEEDWPDFLEKW